jgi:hypothetical protein
MSTEARQKIAQQILTGQWADIREHMERDAIFIVESDLDLVDVGICVVNDDVEAVRVWLDRGSLARPTRQQATDWDKSSDRLFRFVILAPYVLIQELAH